MRQTSAGALLLCLCLLFAGGALGAPTWDRAANIKESAARLGMLHRQQGSNGVLKFLDACYRTHVLASEFTQGLEGCMAQDLMHSHVLAIIHSRIPEAERKRLGAPSPELIARTMNERFAAIYAQYKLPASEAETFRNLVEKDGLPEFLKWVFPKGNKAETPKDGKAN